MKRFTALLVCVLLGVLGAWDSSHSQVAEGPRVSGEPGKGKWPLKGVSEGRIVCYGLSGRPLAESPPFIFFKDPSGELYALNNRAKKAVKRQDSGVRGSLIDEIMVDRRLWAHGPAMVTQEWVNAGKALCKGDNAEALRLADEANQMSLEPLPAGVQAEFSTDEDEAMRRRQYYAYKGCVDVEAEAWTEEHGFNKPFPWNMGRPCSDMLHLTSEELRDLLIEAVAKAWPRP